MHLGFEVRVELELGDGEPVTAQLTRDQAELLELRRARHRVAAGERDGAGQRLTPRVRVASRQLARRPPGTRAGREVGER